MKIVITSTGKDLNSELDRRFGRCAYFLLVDTETNNVEAMDNSAAAAGGGAGIAAAQLIINKGINALITGNVGPNAFQALSAAGIEVYGGAEGRASEVLERFKKGELTKVQTPSVGRHFGLR